MRKGREALGRAVEPATQQFDRNKIPRDPIPARMDEGRNMVNQVLVDLAVLSKKTD